ncbi:MAG: B12-binding domain-containing radical SAM protein [Candidatus Hodarchaeota archaeon]
MYENVYILNFRSREVRYLPTYELLLADGLSNYNCNIEIITIFAYEDYKPYIKRFSKPGSLVLCWESFGTKAPTYIRSYFEFASRFKAVCTNPIYFGGFWATCYGPYFKEFEAFDKILIGYSINKLTEYLRKDQDETGKYVDLTGASNYESYKIFPHFLSTKGKYIVNGALLGYMTSFSCRRNCRFCFANSARNVKAPFAARSLEQVKEDLDVLDDCYKFKGIGIKDLDFFYDEDRAFGILDYLNSKGKKVEINLDITLKQIKESLLRKLKKYGVRDLYFGLESFEEQSRKRIGKYFRNEELEKAFSLADSVGFQLIGNVIMGLPWQTAEEVQSTIRKALYYIERYRNVFIMLNALKPEYGTEIQRRYFPKMHNDFSFDDIVDIYLNNVKKYQERLYGKAFNSMDIEKVFNCMRLINFFKRVENISPYKVRNSVLRLIRRRLGRWVLTKPDFKGLVASVILRRNVVTEIDRIVVMIFSLSFSRVIKKIF